MKRVDIRLAVLTAACVLAGAVAHGVSRPAMASQAAQPGARSLPTFEVERGWMKMPAQWKLGDASSFAVDSQGNVWLLHRPWTLGPDDAAMAAPPVMVFDSEGEFIKAWGGPGDEYEWPQREHGLHIDSKDFVWVTGNNCPTNGLPREPVSDDQILKFAPDGSFVLQIGRSNQSTGNADTDNVHRAADVWVHPPANEVFVADGYGNHRVVVFDADTGAFKRMWGGFGNAPVDDDSCEVVSRTSFPAGPGPDSFSLVHAIVVATDGTVYAADRENRRVQAFSTDGTFVKQLVKTDTTFARGLALSADPAQQFLYVGNGDDIVIVDRSTLEIAGAIDVPDMIGGGHQITADAQGNIYIAQTTAGIQKLSFKGLSGTR